MNAISRINRITAATVFAIVTMITPAIAGDTAPSQLVPDSDLQFLARTPDGSEVTPVIPDTLIGLVPAKDFRFINSPYVPTPDVDDSRFAHIPDGTLFTKSDLDFIYETASGTFPGQQEWAGGIVSPAAGQ
jgi:hypothetical protein